MGRRTDRTDGVLHRRIFDRTTEYDCLCGCKRLFRAGFQTEQRPDAEALPAGDNGGRDRCV